VVVVPAEFVALTVNVWVAASLKVWLWVNVFPMLITEPPGNVMFALVALETEKFNVILSSAKKVLPFTLLFVIRGTLELCISIVADMLGKFGGGGGVPPPLYPIPPGQRKSGTSPLRGTRRSTTTTTTTVD
jgi:hypothetical protein